MYYKMVPFGMEIYPLFVDNFTILSHYYCNEYSRGSGLLPLLVTFFITTKVYIAHS